MKKCTAVCYINSEDKFINAFAIHTVKGDVIDLSNVLKSFYANNFELVTYLVNVAKVNNFEIKCYESFGGKCYDIIFIDTKKPFTVERYIIAG